MKNIVFLSHGGGPLPLLGEPNHQAMVENLQHISQQIAKPSAILVISAHWEESVATVTTREYQELIYDYYNFPSESYEITYPCAGEPKLALAVTQALNKAGIANATDDQRGLDHGVFVPLKIMYPQADIPCVQLSLLNNMSAEQHLQIGQALQAIDWDNLLVIGSGFTFHNMQAFFNRNSPATATAKLSSKDKNIAFENWLTDTIVSPDYSNDERLTRLKNWESAPYARFCHPREEHLLPLHVCTAMAGKIPNHHYTLDIFRKQALTCIWEDVG